MSSRQIHPSIPDPAGTVESLLATVRAIKQSVEILTFGAPSGALGAPLVYVGSAQPKRHSRGDFWVQDTTSKLFYSDGSVWQLISGSSDGTSTTGTSTTVTSSSSTTSTASSMVDASQLYGQLDVTLFPPALRPVERYNSLPTGLTVYDAGRITYLTTDNKLYRWSGTAWVQVGSAADVGTLAASNFPADLRPIEVVVSLPATGNTAGRMVFLSTDNKLYRWTGTAWTAATAATDITGTLADAQIAALDAAKITGQIISTQITNNAVTSPKIAAGSVIAGKIAAGSISATEIAAGAVVAGKIAANAVTATEIAAGSIVTDKIAAGAVSAATIAADAITSNKIQAGAVTAAAIAAGTITAAQIATGTITADQIVSQGITKTSSTVGSHYYGAVGSWQDVLTVTYTCTSLARRTLMANVEFSDETAYGSPNSDSVSFQGNMRISIAGTPTTVDVDSVCSNGTTTALSWVFLDETSRSGSVTFILQCKAVNFSGGSRTTSGFRDPTLVILEHIR